MKRLPWEEMENSDVDLTERLKVPGGWLYRTTLYKSGDETGTPVAVALVFVPDCEVTS